MSKLKYIFLFVVTLGFLVTSLSAQNTNIRLLSLGSCDLVLSDKDNELNIYDFGENPAALIDDQHMTWVAFRTGGHFTQGSFRRQFDPKSQFQLYLQAEGVKPMGENSIFRGFIRYYNEELRHVYRALEYEPYHDVFTVLDTTTGTFDYYGPLLGMEYSHRINSWAAVGGKILYQLQDGLKREASKTKIDGRKIHGEIGAYLTPYRKISLGLTFRPFSDQYRLNANKEYLISYPIIYKLFGDSLLVINDKVSIYNRTARGEGFSLDGTVIYHLFSGLTLAGKGGYKLENKKNDEGYSGGREDIDDYGSWQKEGPFAKIICKIYFNNFPLSFSTLYNWHSWSSWARTPHFKSLFETMNGGWTKYGVGLAYDNRDSIFKLAAEYHFTRFFEEKQNYFQKYDWRRENNIGIFNYGVEVNITSRMAIRFGGATGKDIAEYHLSFDPVRVQRLSLGTGIMLDHLQIDMTAFYEQITPEFENVKRERALVLIQISQWK